PPRFGSRRPRSCSDCAPAAERAAVSAPPASRVRSSPARETRGQSVGGRPTTPYSSGPEPETRKVGGSARSLPPCCRAVSSAESGSSPTPISRRAGLAQGRVNLLVTPDEVATVVNVRWRGGRSLLGGRV